MPVVGAVASGSIAVVIALITKGWLTAVFVLVVVLALQQIEGNVLQPLLLGRAVKLHALAVVLAISTGAVLCGMVGALLSVPTVAVLNSAIHSLVRGEPGSQPVDPLRGLTAGFPTHQAFSLNPPPTCNQVLPLAGGYANRCAGERQAAR